jgi:hypothetical protein
LPTHSVLLLLLLLLCCRLRCVGTAMTLPTCVSVATGWRPWSPHRPRCAPVPAGSRHGHMIIAASDALGFRLSAEAWRCSRFNRQSSLQLSFVQPVAQQLSKACRTMFVLRTTHICYIACMITPEFRVLAAAVQRAAATAMGEPLCHGCRAGCCAPAACWRGLAEPAGGLARALGRKQLMRGTACTRHAPAVQAGHCSGGAGEEGQGAHSWRALPAATQGSVAAAPATAMPMLCTHTPAERACLLRP